MRTALTMCFVLFVSLISVAQVPGTKWIKYINNFSSRSAVFDIKNTRDKGFIIAGVDSSGLIGKTNLINKWSKGKPWIAKLDSSGNLVWSQYQNQNLFPGDLNGAFMSVQQTVDQGFITAGYTGQLALSNSGGDPSNLDADAYIAKYSVDGVLKWEKIFSGANSGGLDDRLMSVQEVNGNGFIVAGFTTSSNGDVVGNHSNNFDAWLLRLDKTGNVIWKKCYGGTANDSAYAILQTPDKGFIVAGSSTSINGDLNGNFGATDAWVFKIDSLGNLLWQKNYGGSGNEAFKSVTLNNDGTYTFVGYSSSTNISGTTNSGQNDVWVVKTTLDGQVIWSKLLGGTADEQGFSVLPTPEGNNLISGYTDSNNGMVSGNNGGGDAWLLKLDPSGNLIWQRCIGTSNDDGALSCISLTERDYMIAGFGQPPSSGISGYVARLGNTNTVMGSVFQDDNNNGIWDANEKGFKEGLVTIAGGITNTNISTTPQNGLFSIDLGNIGIYTATLQINNPYYTSLTTIYNFSFSSYFDTVRFIDFPVRPIPNKKDLVVNLVPLSRPRPGYDGALKISYKNAGTTTISSGEILLAKDSRAHYGYAYPAATGTVGDTLKWTYTNLAPGDSASIVLVQHFDIPPDLNSGDTLKYMAIITPVTGDETPQNDTAILKQIAVNSLDPNDKTENNGGIIGSDYITAGKYLNYTIRFQNTGTDTAFNVIVRDTLDSKLDWSTFEMVVASHPYTVTITNQNKIEWNFSDINLPDSNINEPASHGYLSYRVKPKTTTAVGDVINNLASIYFDFNMPVATNNAITLVQDNFSALPVQLLNFTGQLNSNTVQLNWQTSHETAFEKFEIERSVDEVSFNKIASVAFNNTVHNYKATDNVSALTSKHVFYRLKLVDADGKFSYSKVIAFNINAAQNRFIVYPNPANTEIFVSITANQKSNLQIKIIDDSGRIISEQQKAIDKGSNVFPVNTSKLKKGNYMLQIVTSEETKIRKFTIMN